MSLSDSLIAEQAYKQGYEEGYKAGCEYFVEYMRRSFGMYLVRSDEEVAELKKTHPDLFCLGRKKEVFDI